MRQLLALIALVAVAACDRIPDNSQLAGIYAGQGRDGLCIVAPLGSEKLGVGIVTYGVGNNNCTLTGELRSADDKVTVYADHDDACHFELRQANGALILPQEIPAACSYYCGPGASLAGKRFEKREAASVPKDFGGDPLC
jgi:hypothetical protein